MTVLRRLFKEMRSPVLNHKQMNHTSLGEGNSAFQSPETEGNTSYAINDYQNYNTNSIYNIIFAS